MQTQGIQQLGFVGRHYSSQAGSFQDIRVRFVIGVGHVGHCLQHCHALQQRGHVFESGRGAEPIEPERFRSFHHGLAIIACQCIHQSEHIAAVHTAQHGAHTGLVELAGTKSNGLVRQRERVTHGPPRRARQQAQRLRLGRHVFNAQHLHQVLQHGFRRHRSKVELQAARQHGGRYFLGVRRGQHKLEVIGRLLQRLEHGVEGRVREHVDFVNHEDLEAAYDGFVDGLLQQLRDLVHAPVRRGVQLGVVHKAAAVDITAGLAHPAGLVGDAALPIYAQAVERLGQDARNGGFAHSPCAREQVSVVQPLRAQGIAQRLHDMRLTHHFRKIPGPVFACKNKIRHRAILN